MTEDQLRKQLREQLHRVDDLTPPDPAGFERQALAGGQRRLSQRRAWSTGLLGAAAAVVIGTLVVVSVPRGGGTTASSVAGAAPEQRTGQAAPPAGAGSADGSKQGLAGPTVGADSAAAPPTVVARAGDPAFAFGSVTRQLDDITATLGAPPFDDLYSGVQLMPAPDAQARYYLTRFDPAAMAVVTERLPADAPVAFVQSAFSAKACAATLARVTADAPGLRAQGIPVGGLSCDQMGRVDVTLPGGASPSQRATLGGRYGDAVAVR